MLQRQTLKPVSPSYDGLAVPEMKTLTSPPSRPLRPLGTFRLFFVGWARCGWLRLNIGASYSECLVRLLGSAGHADAPVSHGHGLVDSDSVAAGQIGLTDAEAAVCVTPTIHKLEPLLVSNRSFVTLLANSKRCKSGSSTFFLVHHGGCASKDLSCRYGAGNCRRVT